MQRLSQKKKYLCFCKHSSKIWVGWEAKRFFLLNVYLGYTGQGCNFNSACPKMAIKSLGWALKIRIGRLVEIHEVFRS